MYLNEKKRSKSREMLNKADKREENNISRKKATN